jgi:hypothetical protein
VKVTLNPSEKTPKGAVICPSPPDQGILVFFLPLLNAHRQHTCLSAFSNHLGSPEAEPPSNSRSFVRQACKSQET